MARYHGPKARINRRLGAMLYESRGAVRAQERYPNPPGMHARTRRPSNYGAALQAKQKIKHYYGILEKQLRRYYDNAVRGKGNTGETLLVMCERRLDNVIRRSGLTQTRPQARQGVVHGHFRVNGVKVTSPSYQVRAGDTITVNTRDNVQTVYRSILAEGNSQPLDWLTVDAENLAVNVVGLPTRSDVSLPIDANVVVEFMSR